MKSALLVADDGTVYQLDFDPPLDVEDLARFKGASVRQLARIRERQPATTEWAGSTTIRQARGLDELDDDDENVR